MYCTKTIFFVFALLFQLAATTRHCAAQTGAEDVSAYRPKYNLAVDQIEATNNAQITKQPFAPKLDVTRQLNAKLDSLALKNKRFKYAQGYRILVYTGASSEEVAKIKEQVVALVAEEPVYSIYKQPTFRVKVGDFMNRVDAGASLQLLKKDFPNAILIQDQIVILREKVSEQK
jgi:hypothetical protein